MKQISYWAKNNVPAARIIISFIHILLVLIAFYLSTNVSFHLSFFEMSLIAVIIIIASIIYPKSKKTSYTFQRILLFVTSVGFFLMICFFVQRNFSFPYYQKTLSAISLPVNADKKPTAQEILESLKYRDKSTLTKEEKKILKKEIKKQVCVYTKATISNDKEGKSHALAIILLIIAAVGLELVLSALACSISCGGSGALAIIVFALGTAGIILGTVLLINRINHKKMKTNF